MNIKMTKEEADAWAKGLCENGTYPARQSYKERHKIGSIAWTVWDNNEFVYGIEYGILIAIDKIYGKSAIIDEPFLISRQKETE